MPCVGYGMGVIYQIILSCQFPKGAFQNIPDSIPNLPSTVSLQLHVGHCRCNICKAIWDIANQEKGLTQKINKVIEEEKNQLRQI